MSKEITIKDGGYSLTSPKQMTELAGVLKNHIVKNKLYTTIVGKNYAHVEGWQFAGGMMGLFPRVVEVTDLSKGVEFKWSAKVEIINLQNDKVVSTGFAICSNKENKKKSFDEYAVMSMAQTRAIGKAYRNMLGWVMKLAGYEGTPSEEMRKVGEIPREPVEGSVAGPEGEPVLVCSKCDEIVPEVVANYSKKMYKKILCRNCQPKRK